MKLFRTISILLFALSEAPMPAQQSPLETQSAATGTLSLNVDGLAFFRNDEYSSSWVKGATYPGVRLTPTLCYAPSNKVKIEAGATLLKYWGADKYPNGTYLGLPSADPENSSTAVHALPFVRGVIDTGIGLTVVIGNIYARDCHHMALPLYSRQLQLTQDPEAGAQLIYANHWVEADLWCDWKKFIFHGSPYQENFFVGLSARALYNSPTAKVHYYSPIQALVEHRGGEIDTYEGESVQTLTNAAIGFGTRINSISGFVRSLTIEADMLGAYQKDGTFWKYDQGFAAWVHASAQLMNTTATVGYYYAHHFSPILGSQLFSTFSSYGDTHHVYNPSSFYARWEYEHEFAPGVSLMAAAETLLTLPCVLYQDIPYRVTNQSLKTSLAFEAAIRVNPSFLIKSFSKQK